MRYIVHKGCNYPSDKGGEVRIEPTVSGATIELDCSEKILKVLLAQKCVSPATKTSATVRNIRDVAAVMPKKVRV